MVDVKEIKHIRAAPFTLMTSVIHAILAFIVAILLLLGLGVLAAIPQLVLFRSFINFRSGIGYSNTSDIILL